jgi:dipeptidyl aminopeptidase/acylaminoacyl peptidase
MIDTTYMLPEEETLTRLTLTPQLDETEPDANADGLIVYRQAPAGTALDASGELWLLDIFEQTTTPLGLTGRSPVWSPDGSRIAFMSDLSGSWHIYVYDRVTEEIWIASEGCTTHCRLPAWSPDGEQLIYHASVSLEDFTPTALWIAPAAGGTPRRWLSGDYARPTWSSEGWIAFQGPGGIFRALAGRNPSVERYLYSDPTYATLWSPVWSR